MTLAKSIENNMLIEQNKSIRKGAIKKNKSNKKGNIKNKKYEQKIKRLKNKH